MNPKKAQWREREKEYGSEILKQDKKRGKKSIELTRWEEERREFSRD